MNSTINVLKNVAKPTLPTDVVENYTRKEKLTMPKENRRVRITKMLLNDSFLKLLANKPLARVTVKDICEDADLNRSTYYQYYDNPYDQMTKLKANIIEEMIYYVNVSETATINYDVLYLIIKQLLDYIQSKKDAFQILLSNNGDISLQNDILTVFYEKLMSLDIVASWEHSSFLKEFMFIGSGSYGMIYYWLMIENSESTEELAKSITEFVNTFLQARRNM